MVSRKARLTSALVSIMMILAMMASFVIPMGAETYPSVTTVTAEATGTDYSIANATEWMYVANNLSFFNKDTVTLHLTGTVDFEGKTDFKGFLNPFFSFDGHGNTVKNWGTSSNMAVAMGMFYSGNGQNHGMKFIRNVTLENCYVKAAGSYASALVYAVSHNNAADGKRPAEFTMENVHVLNCAHKTIENNEVHAILLTRYGNIDSDTLVNINNCSIIGTTFDVTGDKAHDGFVIGKPRSNNKGNKAVYNITDLVLVGNTFTDAGEKAGLITGTVENATATVNVKNAIVAGNTITGRGQPVALAGCTSGGFFTLQDSAFSGNTVTSANGVYLVTGSDSSMANLNYALNSYVGDTLTGYGESSSVLYPTVVTDSAKMAELAYNVNKASYKNKWAVQGGKIVVASASAPAPVKVTFTCEGAPDEYVYLTPGSVYTMAYAEGATYAVAGEANGFAVNGDKLTVGTADVTVAVTLAGLKLDSVENAIARFEGKNYTYYASATGVALSELLAEVNEKLAEEDFADQAEVYTYVEKLNAYVYAPYPNVPAVTEVDKYSDSKNFVVKSLTDLEYVASNVGKFAVDVTVHLGADITVTAGSAANRLTGFVAKLDGHGHAIKNVTVASATPTNLTAWIDTYTGTYIGNLVIDGWKFSNIGWKGSILIGYATGASSLTLENITVKNSSLQKASNYGSFTIGDSDNAALTLRNITVEGSTFTRDAGTGNSGLLLGRYSKGTGTLVVENITLNGNTVNGTFAGSLTGGSSGAGLVIGELTAANVSVKNVLCTKTTIGEGHVVNGLLFGRVKGASPVVENAVIEAGAWTDSAPVVRLQKTDNKYDANNAATVTLNNVYSDAAYLTYGDTSSVGANTTVADIENGKLAYELNAKNLEKTYVVNEKGLSFGTEGKPVKVTFTIEGEPVATLYTNNEGKLIGLTEELKNAADWNVDLEGTFAADTVVVGAMAPEFVVGAAAGKNGDTVSVPVSIKNNPGFVGAELKVTYDANALTLVGLEAGDFEVFAEVGDPVVEDGTATVEIVLVAMNGDMPTDITTDGVLGNLQFKITDAARAGKYPVAVTAIEVVNFEEEILAVEDGAAEVTVSCNMVLIPAQNTTKPEEAKHYYACTCGATEGEERCSDSEGWSYVVKPASCTKPGSAVADCAVCGYHYEKTLDVEPHFANHVPADAPDCENDGNIEYWYCDICEKIFADAECTQEITEADTVDPAYNHNYPEAWTHIEGTETHTKVCANNCGKDLVEACSFGEWVEDGDELVKTCEFCGFEKRILKAVTAITGSSETVQVGETLALVLGLENVTDFAGAFLTVTYDSTALELVDAELEGFYDIGPAEIDETTGVATQKIALVLDEAMTADGKLATLNFKALKEGSFDVKVEGIGSSYNSTEYDLVAFEGTVTAEEADYVRGDINGDGRVSISDAVMMMRVAAGDAEVIAIANLDAGNVTTEGDAPEMVINTNDIILVLQYLNKTVEEL